MDIEIGLTTLHMDRIVITILVIALVTMAYTPNFQARAKYILGRFALMMTIAAPFALLDWLAFPIFAVGTGLGLFVRWQFAKRNDKPARYKSTFSKSSRNW